MHKLRINKLGPIKQCELNGSSFITLTGFQASGKSTIAKAIYYFRTIKDDIVELATRQAWGRVPVPGLDEDIFDVGCGKDLKERLEIYLREKLISTFGALQGMSDEMSLEYSFTEDCFIKIFLKSDKHYRKLDDIWVTFSKGLTDFLQEKNNSLSLTPLGVPEEEMKLLKAAVYKLFDDDCSVVYIPAGRSMITLLSQQFNYIYAQMDDMQKRSLDSCTRDYLERILLVKPQFSDGLQGLTARLSSQEAVPPQVIDQALDLIQAILRGTYRYSNGEEQIVLNDGKYVRINFASSGQQECVWILNLLFYYLLQRQRILFIIEEPESHLFPASQKYITELIALVNNCNHSVVLTTHSPYVLGALNNLLYVNTIQSQYTAGAQKVIPKSLWLDFRRFDSWFVQNGTAENCMDSEIHMIQNERIDEISKVINDEFDRILDLQDMDGEGGVV